MLVVALAAVVVAAAALAVDEELADGELADEKAADAAFVAASYSDHGRVVASMTRLVGAVVAVDAVEGALVEAVVVSRNETVAAASSPWPESGCSVVGCWMEAACPPDAVAVVRAA